MYVSVPSVSLEQPLRYMDRRWLLFFIYACSVVLLAGARTLHGKTLRVPFKSIPVDRMQLQVNETMRPPTAGLLGTKKSGVSEETPLDLMMVASIFLGETIFAVTMDTGSRALWVYGKDVNKNYFHKYPDTMFEHEFYDEEKESETFQPYSKNKEEANKIVEYKYGDGQKVEGKLGLETLTFGLDLTVTQTQFAIVSKLSGPENQNTFMDGIFGLGYEDPSSDSAISPVTSMIQKGLLREKMFSIFKSKDGESGNILFGDWDKSRVRSRSIKIVPVLERGDQGFTEWVIAVNCVTLGRHKIVPESGGEFFNALVDTGTVSIVLPPSILKHKAFKKNRELAVALESGLGVPCEARKKLPNLSFRTDEGNFYLSGEDYTAPPGSLLSRPDPNNPGKRLCSLLVRSGKDPHRIILGGPFFRKHYTMFHYEYTGMRGPVIGIGTAIHNGDGPGETYTQDEQRDWLSWFYDFRKALEEWA